nr:hypothetical protein CFP56_78986 [Quercus suber]
MTKFQPARVENGEFGLRSSRESAISSALLRSYRCCGTSTTTPSSDTTSVNRRQQRSASVFAYLHIDVLAFGSTSAVPRPVDRSD